jgi:4-alpha-glucanotransferase
MTLRRAGITLPLFSLRGEEDAGIGEIEDLAGLVDWAAANGQRLIALLPLGDLGPGEYSPYNALSSFAIDPLLVRPSRIAELRGVSLPERAAAADGTRVDRERARAWKEPLFARAFATFEALGPDHPRKRAFAEFRARADSWLADYSLFRALLEAEGNRWWKEWPAALREREPAALAEARTELADRIRFFEYLQFVAAEAWERVHREARERDVWLMGDLPFAPSENSADVWSNPELFDPTRCTGAPPDAFSETGQRWGLPMYRWSALRASHWRLLRLRARRMAELYDLFRVDHVVGLFRTFGFRGEEPCGFDPAEEADQRAQGREILEIMLAEAAPAGVVAEDLGTIPKFVPETLSGLDVPGYQVLRWQRVDERVVDPLEYPECSIATTGTHDTDTLVEWWESLALEERAEYAEAVGCAVDAPEPVRRLAILERLYRSPSRYVVPPVQDLFGWRERINTPATVGEGNWRYRLPLTIDGLSRDPAM